MSFTQFSAKFLVFLCFVLFKMSLKHSAELSSVPQLKKVLVFYEESTCVK